LCLTALREEVALPDSVRGPVDVAGWVSMWDMGVGSVACGGAGRAEENDGSVRQAMTYGIENS
jgi:hypothetical protein